MAPTFTPDSQRFRETVALVASRAKAKLPEQVNGRIEGAVKLVLSHDVTPLADGTIEVGSSTDPLKVYTLTGQACTCKDFTDGKAPDGWCRHRIAAGIAKRVGEVLAAIPPTPGPAPQVALPEAPASVNVRLTTCGREVQWTLRDTDEARLAVRLEELLQRYPVPQPAPQASSQGQGKGWCAVHNVAMQANEKHGQRWFSHRLPDDSGWCKGRK